MYTIAKISKEIVDSMIIGREEEIRPSFPLSIQEAEAVHFDNPRIRNEEVRHVPQ